MTISPFNYVPNPNGVPLKMWTKGVPVEPQAVEQLLRAASMPFVFRQLAIMPDVHAGRGSTIGTVIATKGAIVPATVGVDLGCGMMAVKTSLTANDLPDDLSKLRSGFESVVPVGRTDNGAPGADKGAWGAGGQMPNRVEKAWLALEERFNRIVEKHPRIGRSNNVMQLGTLGGGNHFIEVCLDEEDCVWVMLHSGSRGLGAAIGNYFINAAKEEMARYHITKFLPDQDLSYLVEHTQVYDDYIEAVQLAQDFAMTNRVCMMEAVLAEMRAQLPAFFLLEEAVNCHHNYVEKENHFGQNVLVTRKGAVRARLGDLGIIPGSMGARSFIVRGKGEKESFCSCSHGAGRTMSRNAAEKVFTLEDHAKATAGVECRKDIGVIDETPGAYKDIDAVMAAQADLVDTVAILKQVLCVKG